MTLPGQELEALLGEAQPFREVFRGFEAMLAEQGEIGEPGPGERIRRPEAGLAKQAVEPVQPEAIDAGTSNNCRGVDVNPLAINRATTGFMNSEA